MKRLFCAAVGLILASIAACGGDDASYTYGATSNSGDLSTWTISGNALTVEWLELNSDGTVEMTYNVTATCGDPEATYNYRNCVIDTASCTDGSVTCSGGPAAGEAFKVFELPGTAIMVSNTDNSELSVGFARGNCETIAESDYTFVNVGLGQQDIFGMFRLDSTYTDVTHLDFGFSDPGAAPSNRIKYNTGDINGQTTIPESSCVNGVRTISVGGDTVRVLITPGGFLVVDKPEGQGGLVAFKSSMAATASDIANKTLVGMSFPDNGDPEFLTATTGAATRSTVPLTGITLSTSGAAADTTIRLGNDTVELSKALVDNGGNLIANNPLFSGKTKASDVPGVVEIASIGDELGVFAIIGKTNDNKIFMVGAVVNDRDNENENTGNFIAFEK